jgi:hypothetical protein
LIAALLVGVLAIAVATWVVAPFFRPDALETERVARALSAEEDLHTRYTMTVAALRDLDEDRATGKVGDADYDAQRSLLSSRAVDLMKQLDDLGENRPH